MWVRYSPAIRFYMTPHALHGMTAHALSAPHAPGNKLHKLLQTRCLADACFYITILNTVSHCMGDIQMASFTWSEL